MKQPKGYRNVIVFWEDAAAVEDHKERAETIIECRMGVLIPEESDDHQVVVASGLFADGSYRDRIVIPRVLVRRIFRGPVIPIRST